MGYRAARSSPSRIQEFDPLALLQDVEAQLLKQARQPNIYAYQPHPKQVLFHGDPHQERLFVAGNRSGKSYACAAECVWWLTKRHPYRKTPEGQIRGRVVAVDFLNGVDKIVLPLIKQLMPTEYLIDGSWDKSFSKERRILTLKDGSFLEFMSQDQDLDKFAGTSRHFIWFDEECPKVIFTECVMRLLDTNGDWWISETPVAGMEWIYDDFFAPYMDAVAAGEPPKIGLIHMRTDENPYLAAEAIDRIFAGMTPEERAVRMAGEYLSISGSLYKEFKEYTHATQNLDEFDFDPMTMRVYLTGDHGINNPTAWLWVVADKLGNLTVVEELYETGTTVQEHAKTIKEINAELGRRWGMARPVEPYLITGDPMMKQRSGFADGQGRPMSILDEYGRHGIHISVEGIPRDKSVGINKILQYLKVNPKTGRPFFTVLRNCPNTIRELKLAKQNRYVNKLVASMKNAPEGQREKDDHTTDAVRYLMTFMPDLSPQDYDGTAEDRWDFVAEYIDIGTTWRTNQERKKDPQLFGWRTAGGSTTADYSGIE